jgi:hypothetical protein
MPKDARENYNPIPTPTLPLKGRVFTSSALSASPRENFFCNLCGENIFQRHFYFVSYKQ